MKASRWNVRHRSRTHATRYVIKEKIEKKRSRGDTKDSRGWTFAKILSLTRQPSVDLDAHRNVILFLCVHVRRCDNEKKSISGMWIWRKKKVAKFNHTGCRDFPRRSYTRLPPPSVTKLRPSSLLGSKDRSLLSISLLISAARAGDNTYGVSRVLVACVRSCVGVLNLRLVFSDVWTISILSGADRFYSKSGLWKIKNKLFF